jgi:hypothetical protein
MPTIGTPAGPGAADGCAVAALAASSIAPLEHRAGVRPRAARLPGRVLRAAANIATGKYCFHFRQRK